MASLALMKDNLLFFLGTGEFEGTAIYTLGQDLCIHLKAGQTVLYWDNIKKYI